MRLKRLEIMGFKSFAKKSVFEFNSSVSAVVGPNGSGKSNVAEAIRFVLGEQSMKSMRTKRGEDLIWNGSQSAPRSNHASVSIVFDNAENEFDIDYDEVVIKRQVYRDGENQYFINNTQVRLRDINELLSKVHIGATGHHIISQGEADRILTASTKDRRAMIEEALGLKIYGWKINESLKKLAKTEENLKQVASLRREIAPHIRFLKSQVSKIEKLKDMRTELSGLYSEYLKREKIYLQYKKAKLSDDRVPLDREIKKIDGRLTDVKEKLAQKENKNPEKSDVARIYSEIAGIRLKKDEMHRSIGRIEGMVEFEEKRISKIRENNDNSPVESISYDDVKYFVDNIEDEITKSTDSTTIDEFKNIFSKLRSVIENFLSSIKLKKSPQLDINTDVLEELKKEKKQLNEEFSKLESQESLLDKSYNELKDKLEKEKDSGTELEKEMFQIVAERTKLASIIDNIKKEQEYILKEENRFKDEIKEGIVLVGRDIALYENFSISNDDGMFEDRSVQETRRKKIEKIKIRLEDQGLLGADDTMKEYEEVLSRDSFLEREIVDLEKSSESLRLLVVELTEKLNNEFKDGIKKINRQFQEFFSLMFGGGNAELLIVAKVKRKRSDIEIEIMDDEYISEQQEETEEGIEVSVSLPRKKIKGLQMLSGGERALTSIALIFAVSQVNPPPFIVLDETDAALDEANSRKYGNMIENLSSHSQLIVITHNRETMSRAGILYGVTMGADAISKLLSVKFDEAKSFAK